jgi:hypothetical protein
MKIVITNFFNYILRILKQGYRRLIRIEGDPRNIALGFAMGLLVGMTPTMGFQMPIAVFFAIPLRLNKLSSVAGVWITNPFSAPVIYPINFLVGVKLFNIDVSTEQIMDFSLKSLKSLLTETPDIFLAATLGGVVLGIPIAICGYYFVMSAVTRYRAHKIKTPSLS